MLFKGNLSVKEHWNISRVGGLDTSCDVLDKCVLVQDKTLCLHSHSKCLLNTMKMFFRS